MNATEGPNLPRDVTGLALSDDYVAVRTNQGGRLHYSLALPLPQVPIVFPIPDPEQPVEDNRAVRLQHAQGFANYIRSNPDWFAGPLTVRTDSAAIRFEAFDGGDYGFLQLGLLKVPRNNREAFRYVDGQHRGLGVSLLLSQLSAELQTARQRLVRARSAGGEPAVIAQLEAGVSELERIQARCGTDCFSVDLIVEDDPTKARQVFVDVANNALGVARAVVARFDARKVVNRALNLMLDEPACPLLAGRVDIQNDRVVGANPNLLGAKHLAEVIRALTVGINGRISRAQEMNLNERDLARHAARFFDVLTESFPVLKEIAEGAVPVNAARRSTLVVSTTMIRVLAGVYYRLKEQGLLDPDIVEFFARLSKHMGAPVDGATQSGVMLINATDSAAFVDGANAPGARAQQVKDLVEVLAKWQSDPPHGF